MMPRFRRGVLGWEEDTSKRTELSQLLVELQKIFAYLQDSKKQYYDPSGKKILGKF
jgi:hypothetical protein